MIDCLEKCAFVYKTKPLPQMLQLLQAHGDPKIYEKLISKQHEKAVIEYW